MIKNKIWYIMIVLIISGVIGMNTTITGTEAKEPMAMLNQGNHKIGNTMGNIMNGGYITEQAGWVYFSDYNFNTRRSGLYKMTTAGKERVKLSNDNAYFINVSGDWLYFIASDRKDYKIYKMQTNGKRRTKICDDKAGGIYLADNWLYYLNFSDNGRLYKINIIDNRKIKISDDEINDFCVDGEWIYYISKSDNEALYRMSTDGLNKTKITEEKMFNFIKVSDWIYYKNQSDFKLYRINISGKNKEELGIDSPWSFNVYKENIIFADTYDNKPGIYKLDLNGGKIEKINTRLSDERSIRGISIINDWIYFQKLHNIFKNSKAATQAIYRMKIDGSEFERISIMKEEF